MFTQNRSVAGEKGADINLANDEEEGFSAMRSVLGERGGFSFNSRTPVHVQLLKAVFFYPELLLAGR